MGRVTDSQVHTLVVAGVATCWGLTLLVWVAGAVYNGVRAPRTGIERPLASSMLTAATVVGLVWVIRLVVAGSAWQSLAVGAPWVRLVGLVVLICSTVFTLWARVALGTMWSPSPTVKVAHQLRTDGPYSVTRHPIYTGLLGMLLGTVFLLGFGHWLELLPVALVFVELRIRVEERMMVATFPQAYPGYRGRVPQLLPRARRSRRPPTAS